MTVAAGAPMVLGFERLPGTVRLEVSGEIAVGDQVTRAVSLVDPIRHFLTALREVFAAHGIEIGRGIAVQPEPGDSATLPVPLVRHESPPLRELAATAMRTSHNLHAESLFRALARLEMPAGTVEDARRSIKELLERWGVPGDAVIVADGSGLSRDNLVTASALMAVLRGMATDDTHRDEWMALFPAGGREGTLNRRFAVGVAAGRVRAKTGTLSAVKALSGYVRTAGGELLAFVMIVNNAAGSRQEVEGVLDRAVERLASFER
jgi:D-alanyl-D-alanine carboxypeptidase/D-alanyl-D-alanine-endopeptidase (penicillin-binding protein 4)